MGSAVGAVAAEVPGGSGALTEGSGDSSFAVSCGLALEVANTLLLSYVLTELLLSKRRLWEVRGVLAALPAMNILLSPRVHAVLGRLAAALGVAGGPSPLGSAPSTGSIESDAAARNGTGGSGDSRSSSSSAGALDAGSNAAIGASVSGADAAASSASGSSSGGAAAAEAVAAAASSSPLVRGLLRIAFAAVGFSALMYFDVRRFRPRPYALGTFAAELRGALGLVLPVFPFLVMAFSFAFLILTSLLEAVGMPEHLGEEIILYGQFYAPFSMVYWIVKKDWLAAERSVPLLPMATSSAPEGRGNVLGGGGGSGRLGGAQVWGAAGRKAAGGRTD
mmetsp:Transcript_53631/g.136082  ORF Transcript_53631/g.136082 Transcript_53631/m.136082 type:complete len:335 (+) Transcript_53631:55-1059(+)